MKILKTASGKQSVKMSKSEWQSIGKTAGWMKIANSPNELLSAIGDYAKSNKDYCTGNMLISFMVNYLGQMVVQKGCTKSEEEIASYFGSLIEDDAVVGGGYAPRGMGGTVSIVGGSSLFEWNGDSSGRHCSLSRVNQAGFAELLSKVEECVAQSQVQQ